MDSDRYKCFILKFNKIGFFLHIFYICIATKIKLVQINSISHHIEPLSSGLIIITEAHLKTFLLMSTTQI